MTPLETRLAAIVARYLQTGSRSALEEYRRWVKGKRPKREDLADVDADARALLARIEKERAP